MTVHREEKGAMDYQPRDPPGRPITSDPFFSLRAGDDGVGFVHCDDAVLVLPLTEDGRVLLAVERAAALGEDAVGLVGGSVEEGEPLEETANRELQEELGWRAGRIDYLGELRPFKYLTTRQFLFLARDLEPASLQGDEVYPVGVREAPLDRVLELYAEGVLHDAATLAAVCLACRFLRHECAEPHRIRNHL